MKITDHKNEIALGYGLTYRLYQPEIPSGNYVLFMHGMGEIGPIDGSKLDLVEKNSGFPKSAKLGFEFPFNIIAVQVDKSYSMLQKFIIPYIKLKYKADRIFVTGLSLGGIATWDILSKDDFYFIDGAAPVCGKLSSPTMAMTAQIKEYPIMAFHGSNDATVNYGGGVASVDAYNANHTTKAVLVTYQGIGHNCWDLAYSLDPGKDMLYQFALKVFEQPVKGENDFEVYKQKVIEAISSKTEDAIKLLTDLINKLQL